MDKKLITTEDGSHSFFVPKLGENYHSRHGAIQESLHVFIQSGLNKINKKTIRIFEMGFGSGLNALLTLQKAKQNNLSIIYDTIELYPLGNDDAKKMNYSQLLGIPGNLFMKFHESEWEVWNQLEPGFKFRKKNADLKNFSTDESYDLIYFDAFSPEVQPDLWETPIFKPLFKALNPGGILTSYSVRGKFRRSLKEVGFRVEKIPGPPGKRQITRAWKD